MSSMTGESQNATPNGHIGETGVIVESNFKVFAYTVSSLLLTVVGRSSLFPVSVLTFQRVYVTFASSLQVLLSATYLETVFSRHTEVESQQIKLSVFSLFTLTHRSTQNQIGKVSESTSVVICFS